MNWGASVGAINGSEHYATANAFRRALDDRLKTQSKIRGRSLEEVRREFLFQRFLALVFSPPGGQWVLKGGASLLMRLSEARFSRDLDLLHLGELSVTDAIDELRGLTRPRDGDHLTFVIGQRVTTSRTNPVAQIHADAYIGAEYGSFPIDLARELHIIAAPEWVRPVPVVEIPGLSEPPHVLVYPLPDQVADKLCAMYELYGHSASPSSRYRDLVDLALIVASCELEAEPLVLALRSESRRRRLQLPDQLISPGPGWATGYLAYARRTRIDNSLRTLDSALKFAGACLNPLLKGVRVTGRWSPRSGWTD
ncbi:nucleotidyl transferase AbiEii/AbiGii toxin family protein [Tessaracoccus sp. G1721]